MDNLSPIPREGKKVLISAGHKETFPNYDIFFLAFHFRPFGIILEKHYITHQIPPLTEIMAVNDLNTFIF